MEFNSITQNYYKLLKTNYIYYKLFIINSKNLIKKLK